MPDSETTTLVKVTRTVSPLELGDTTGRPALAGYGTALTGEPVEPFTRAGAQQRPTQQRRTGSAASRRPETRAVFRAHWKSAKEAAERMLHAAEARDVMELAVAADNLDVILGKLWELRAERDLNWKTIVNHAQGMFRQLFAAKQVEQLTAEQCSSILQIVDRYLGPGGKTVDDLTEVIRLIEDAGFDPYGAISGDPTSAPGE